MAYVWRGHRAAAERTQEAFKKDGKPSRRKSHMFAYAGLLTCTHCGCAVTAERKKGKYIYYHCTGGRGNCERPYIREEDLEELFSDVVQAIALDAAEVEWLKDALRESHADEREYHDEQVSAIEKERASLQQKLDRGYEDLLDGKIMEDMWRRKSAEWRDRLVRLQVALEDHTRANAAYFDEGFRILGLANRAYDLWLEQEAEERRKLLNILLSNCSFDGERLRATYRKPFCWIAEGRECSDWLPLLDSLRKWLHSEECRELAEAM